MTDVAGGLSDRVARALAFRDLAVVTVGTRSEGLSVVHETVVSPRRREMAALAIIRGYGMRAEKRCRARGGHPVVAAEASRRRGLVTPVDVARRTRDVDVCAGEGKSSGTVIEPRRRRVLCLRRCCDKHYGRCNQR